MNLWVLIMKRLPPSKRLGSASKRPTKMKPLRKLRVTCAVQKSTSAPPDLPWHKRKAVNAKEKQSNLLKLTKAIANFRKLGVIANSVVVLNKARSEIPANGYSEQDLLKSQQAAEFLKISAKTLANWRNKGKGPNFVKIGGSVSYRFRDLEAFVAIRVYSSTSALTSAPVAGGINA